MFVCDMVVASLITLSYYPYCEPAPIVIPSHGSLYWRCDCAVARKNVYFRMQENINKAFLEVSREALNE